MTYCRRLIWGRLRFFWGSPTFLPVRRYTSAVTSYVPVSAYVFVTSRCSVETDGRIKLVFGTEASFDLSYTYTQCCKEIQISKT